MPDSLESHCNRVAEAIADGKVIPLLGAGVNLSCRREDLKWKQGEFLPNGGELAEYLATSFGYPSEDKRERKDLLRVSQYIALKMGAAPLYEELHSVFNADYPPTPIHDFFANLPKRLREKGLPERLSPVRHPYQLIVSTNYDDVLERAFATAKEPCDLVSYIADGPNCGKFEHRTPEGKYQIIESPGEYMELDLNKQTVILKIHGAVDRVSIQGDKDSFVITEDDYIEYLTRTDIESILPKTLVSKMNNSHFLFLGYALRDWNLRAILHRVWKGQRRSYTNWAVQNEEDPMDREFWKKRNVEIQFEELEKYITSVSLALQARKGSQRSV
jgi:SIR2-like protein